MHPSIRQFVGQNGKLSTFLTFYSSLLCPSLSAAATEIGLWNSGRREPSIHMVEQRTIHSAKVIQTACYLEHKRTHYYDTRHVCPGLLNTNQALATCDTDREKTLQDVDH